MRDFDKNGDRDRRKDDPDKNNKGMNNNKQRERKVPHNRKGASNTTSF